MGKKVAEMSDAEWKAFVERTGQGGSRTSAYSAPKKKKKDDTKLVGTAYESRERPHRIDEATGYKDGGYVYAKPRSKRGKYKYNKR